MLFLLTASRKQYLTAKKPWHMKLTPPASVVYTSVKYYFKKTTSIRHNVMCLNFVI